MWWAPHPSSPRISIHPSCSDWSPLHLASLADTPSYGSGSGSQAQMVWVFQHHLPCFFQPRRWQEKVQTHLALYIQWEMHFPLHNIPQSNRWALNPADLPLARVNWFKPDWEPSSSLVLSVFHNPAPTGSYGILGRMEGLWNVLLVNQFLENG